MNKFNRPTIIILATLMLVCLVIGAFWLINQSPDTDRSNSEEDTAGSIIYSPPTTEERNEVDQQKEQLSEDEEKDNIDEANTDNEQQADKLQLKPIITRADQGSDGVIRVRALVDSDESGACRAIFSKNNSEFIITVDASFQTSYYQCEPINVDSSKFDYGGTWTAVVEFSSNNKEGVSESRQFEVTK